MADWNRFVVYCNLTLNVPAPRPTLLSRIAHLQVEHAVDLGCGPGNSTRLLRAAWPLATIVGIDNSPGHAGPGGGRPYPTVSSSTPILPAGGLRNRQM